MKKVKNFNGISRPSVSYAACEKLPNFSKLEIGDEREIVVRNKLTGEYENIAYTVSGLSFSSDEEQQIWGEIATENGLFYLIFVITRGRRCQEKVEILVTDQNPIFC